MTGGRVTQREYFERLFTEHEKHHQRDHLATMRALDTNSREMERRLEALNELRDEVTKDRAQFVRSETFDARMEAITLEFKGIRSDIGGIREELSNARGRQATWAVVLTVVLVLVTIASRYIGTDSTPPPPAAPRPTAAAPAWPPTGTTQPGLRRGPGRSAGTTPRTRGAGQPPSTTAATALDTLSQAVVP